MTLFRKNADVRISAQRTMIALGLGWLAEILFPEED